MTKSNESKAVKATAFSSSIRYLPCEAEPGMFKGELLVYVDGFDPREEGKAIKAQLLVDQREVEGLHDTPRRHQPVQGWLKVMLANTKVGLGKGLTTVILPQAAQPVGESLLVSTEGTEVLTI